MVADDPPRTVDDEALATALEKKMLSKTAKKTKAQLAILRQMEAYLKTFRKEGDTK